MSPKLHEAEFIFCTLSGELSKYCQLKPIATFLEKEGVILILQKTTAQKVGLFFENSFRQIILEIHSSLEAVGLTAMVTQKLASKGISANVVATYYHDYIFVQATKAQAALVVLQ